MRFSKRKLTKYVLGWQKFYENNYGFNSATGYAQVEGKITEIKVAYGKYDFLETIIDDFDLWLEIKKLEDEGWEP